MNAVDLHPSGASRLRNAARPRQPSLAQAAANFLRYPTARIIGPVAVVATVARLIVGGWGWWDLAIPAIILALEPFTEWTTHVFLLHFRPRRVLGVRIDPLAARKHRAHHADPRNIALVFIPLQILVVSLAVAVAGFWLLLPTPQLAFTTMATSFWMLLTYEWTHYLIHSPYRPRTRFYRYVWRAHRLHHFRNERYWFGVTVHVADHLLRTFPEKDSVPVSPTARTLGVIESGTATAR
jgi:hypothetical protein